MWKQLTLDDLAGALNTVELENYSQASTDAAVPDRAVEILEQLTQQIRGDIASHSLNTLSTDESLIPESYHYQALAIARYRLLSSLPYGDVTDARKEEYKEAIKFFDSVARGVRRPEPAADARKNEAAPSSPASGAQVVTSRPRITGRDNLAGL